MGAFAILGVGSRNVASGRSGRIISWLGALGPGVSYSPERLKRKRGRCALTANNSRRGGEQKFKSNKKVTYTWRVWGSVILTTMESQANITQTTVIWEKEEPFSGESYSWGSQMCGTSHASHHKHSCPSPNNQSMSKWPPNAFGTVENLFLSSKYRVRWLLHDFHGSDDALRCYWECLETCKDHLQHKIHVINKENTLSDEFNLTEFLLTQFHHKPSAHPPALCINAKDVLRGSQSAQTK